MAGENVGCNSPFPEKASRSCSSESEDFRCAFPLSLSSWACAWERAEGRLRSSEGGVYSWGLLLEEERCGEESDGGVYSCAFLLEEERRCDERFGGVCSWGFLLDEG